MSVQRHSLMFDRVLNTHLLSLTLLKVKSIRLSNYRGVKETFVNGKSTFLISSFSEVFFFYLDFLTQTFTITGQQGKGEAISSTPLYHFHPLHRHLDISQAITAVSSPLRIVSRRTYTGNLWFPSASR